MGKMIETARVRVAGDKEASLAVERLALKMASLGRKASSPRIGLEGAARAEVDIAAVGVALDKLGDKSAAAEAKVGSSGRDRKSTRLNSSHTVISYAVFCLKKKKTSDTLHTVSTFDMMRRRM